MIICGQEFEFSALNANDLDRMDAAQQHMQAASDRESKRAHTGTADILRGQCRLMMGYFDELLGEGASERLGLDGNNFGACVRVTNAIKESIAAEQATVKQAAAMPMNREQRRAVAKQKKTGPYQDYNREHLHPWPDRGLLRRRARRGGSRPDRRAENRAADRCSAGRRRSAGRS